MKQGAHIHIMGICGTAMASLAGILKNMGYKITGSDQNVYPPMSTQLEKLGVQIKIGYKAENLNPKPDLVIVGNVITKKHEEAQALLESDIPYTSFPKALGEFVIQDRHSIVIAGTHGKTTTTSMMAWVADQCGLTPGFLIGGIPHNFQSSFAVPTQNSKYFIIEGDEYDTAFFDKVPKFVHYKPKSVIFTSCEFDHADIYKDLDAVKSAFLKLITMIAVDGNLVFCAEDQNVRELVEKSNCKNKISYGVGIGDYQAHNIEFNENFCEFDVVHNDKNECHIKLKVFGRHNIANALSCYVMSKRLNLNLQNVLSALETFSGVKRRQEIIGNPRNIIVIEDFAHHPTAVEVTINSIKERYKKSKVISLFEPRSATSRRNYFQKDYVKAFRKSDVVILPEIFNSAALDNSEQLSPQKIIDDLNMLQREAYFIPKVDEIVNFLKGYAKSGDVILLMSNGAFDGIYQKLLSALK